MKDLAEAFGKVLEQKRKKAMLSQEDLAIKADLNRTYISDLETGKYNPTLKTIFKLAKQLKVEPETLIVEVKKVLSK